jgi:ectoine hydroxylase-related dioxygenase (phytanoyl-CoA dioxygenase family)
MIDDHWQLERDGFTVLEGVMSQALLAEVRERVDELLADQERNPSPETRWEANARRLGNLADHGNVFWKIATCPEALGAVKAILGQEIKLSSMTLRSANPNSNSNQPLHVDQNMLPDDRGCRICNALWMLDDFTAENGPLRIIPGSHRSQKRPQDCIEDTFAKHPEEVIVTGVAGSAIILNAHVWHGGTANRTPRARRGLSVLYCRRDVAQQQYQRKALRAETQAAANGELRTLLALDDSLNDWLAAEDHCKRLETLRFMSLVRGSDRRPASD